MPARSWPLLPEGLWVVLGGIQRAWEQGVRSRAPHLCAQVKAPQWQWATASSWGAPQCPQAGGRSTRLWLRSPTRWCQTADLITKCPLGASPRPLSCPHTALGSLPMARYSSNAQMRNRQKSTEYSLKIFTFQPEPGRKIFPLPLQKH